MENEQSLSVVMWRRIALIFEESENQRCVVPSVVTAESTNDFTRGDFTMKSSQHFAQTTKLPQANIPYMVNKALYHISSSPVVFQERLYVVTRHQVSTWPNQKLSDEGQLPTGRNVLF